MTMKQNWMLPALVILGILCLVLIGLVCIKYISYNELEGEYRVQSQELASTQTRLSDAEAELSDAEAKLDSTEAQLSSTQTVLTSIQTKLRNAQGALDRTQIELQATQVALANTRAFAAGAQTELASLRHKINLYNELGMTIYEGTQPPGGWYHLANNPAATNPTWQQLKSFLLADSTDERPYIKDVYMCGEFARDAHNNAEAAGIRAAWVSVDWGGWEAQSTAPHALNVFVTSDRGAIYIDCTGVSYPTSSELDTIAHVEIGEPLTFTSIGPPYGDWIPFPTVVEIQVYW